jgi:hypothetical protein
MTKKLSQLLTDVKAIVTIILAVLALAGWAFGLTAKVQQHDKQIDAIEVKTDVLQREFIDRSARMETNLEYLVQKERARKE